MRVLRAFLKKLGMTVKNLKDEKRKHNKILRIMEIHVSTRRWERGTGREREPSSAESQTRWLHRVGVGSSTRG